MIILINFNKLLHKDKGVSEVLGVVLLLGISVTVLGAVYTSFYAFETDKTNPSVNIAASINDVNLTLYHSGGDDLPMNSKIIIIDETDKYSNLHLESVMDIVDKQDGVWGIDEKVVCDLTALPELRFNRYDPLSVQVVDSKTESIVMMAKVKEPRSSDLRLEVTKEQIGESNQFWINTTVTNLGPFTAENVVIKSRVPTGFDLLDVEKSVEEGYELASGRWNIGTLEKNEFRELKLLLKVPMSQVEPTQLAVILDGTAPQPMWDEMVHGLNLSIQSGAIPHNGAVELTVIQYGVNQLCGGYVPTAFKTPPYGLGPCVLGDCSSDVTCVSCCDCYRCVGRYIEESLVRMGGQGSVPDNSYPEMFVVPMSSGFKKARMELEDHSAEYEKQTIMLMACNIPNCYIPDDEEGVDATMIPLDIFENIKKEYPSAQLPPLPSWCLDYEYLYSPGKADALEERNRMLKDIMTDENRRGSDVEIDVAVFPEIQDDSAAPPCRFTGKESDWFLNHIPYPQPGINWTTETEEPNQEGWYRLVKHSNHVEEIENTIQSMYSQIFERQDGTELIKTMEIEIASSKYADPNPEDNSISISISYST